MGRLGKLAQFACLIVCVVTSVETAFATQAAVIDGRAAASRENLTRAIVHAVAKAVPIHTVAHSASALLALSALEHQPNIYEETQYDVTFLDRNGKEIGSRGKSDIPLEEIPDSLIKATLAAEDRFFFFHSGIDIIGTVQAIASNARSPKVVQGSTTLTRQLAKNLFLASDRSISRKVKEFLIACWLETQLSKREILSLFLNRSYLGGGTRGVAAASQFYFGKHVRDITLAEAALLAGQYRAPTVYAPHVNPAKSRDHTDQVLTKMVEAGFISEDEARRAHLNPAKIADSSYYTPDHFLDWAFGETQRLTAGKKQFRLTVRTTVDLRLQRVAESEVAKALGQHDNSANTTQGALVSMEMDGAVRALVGGRDYSNKQPNRATQVKRQTGSSLAPFVYLMAIEGGAQPDTRVRDEALPCGNWRPPHPPLKRNEITLTSALALSLNTVVVQLSLDEKYGARDQFLKTLSKLGLGDIRKTCSMALGDQGVTLLDHTSAYATLASGGKRVKGYAVVEIRNRRNEIIYLRKRDEQPAEQIFDRKAVETLNRMLTHVLTEGTGREAKLDFTTAAGKTGITADFKDTWFLGFTGQYVTGVWFGNDNSPSIGGTNPLRVAYKMSQTAWKAFNVAAHTGRSIPPIPGVRH